MSRAEKWRPSLWFVLGGALASTLFLSLLGIVILRYLGPEIGFRNAAYLLVLGIGGITVIIWVLLLRLLLRFVLLLLLPLHQLMLVMSLLCVARILFMYIPL